MVTRAATFASPLGERLAFYSMTGREGLSELFNYEVDLLSDDDSVPFKDLLGQAASVLLEKHDGTIREFNGIVTHLSIVGQHGRFARYRAILRPWLWLLRRNRDSRIFQNKTVPEVVKQILRERGFTDIGESFSATYRPWEYLVQYQESDCNFISRILEQQGIHYYFEHAAGKHKFCLADSNEAHQLSEGYATVPYFPPLERERREEEHLDTWTMSMQVSPGRFATRDYDFKKPAVLGGMRRAPFEHAAADFEVYDYPGVFNESEHGDEQARIRLEEQQVEHEVVRGGGPVRGLQAGSRFKLENYPRDDQNREVLVVRAAYEIRVNEYESNVVVDLEPNFRFDLVAIDAKRPYRPARRTPKPRVEGPQTAIVVGKEGNEIWTDEYGRVKVQFHWDREGERDEESSCWVRVSQVWAGAQWGAMHIPRMRQEVIVDFLEGDPDRPVITGRLYNEEQRPPYGLPENATQSGIKSRSTSGGSPNNFNEIRFEDKKGEEELHLQAEKDMTTLVKNDQSTTVQASRSASVGGSDSVSVGGDRSVTVKGNLTTTVKGGGGGPYQSSHNVTGKHLLETNDMIDVKAPNQIMLASGGSYIIIAPSGITMVAKDGAAITLTKDVFAQSAGSSTLAMSETILATSNGLSELKLDGKALLKSPDEVKLDGKTVLAEGATEATVKSGGNTAKLSPASIDVSGTTVNVTGKTTVSITGAFVKVNS